MSSLAALAWRQPAVVAVSGPDGWMPVQRLDVLHAAGTARISIESWPLSGSDLDQFVTDHGAAMASSAAQWTDLGVSAATVLGREQGRQRECSWVNQAGGTFSATIGYRLDPGVVYVISVVRGSGELPPADEIEAVVASITIGTVLEPDRTPPSEPLRAQTWDTAAWSAARAAWVRDAHERSDLHEKLMSYEEALAVAKGRTATAFPGIDARFLSSLDRAQSDVALRVAARALEARLVADTGLAADLDVALAHDLLVAREWRSGDKATASWCAARPDVTVVLEPDPQRGVVSIARIETGAMAAHLMDGSQAGPDPADREPLATSSALLSALVRGEVDPQANPELAHLAAVGSSLTRVRSVYRDAGSIAGGEVEWLDAGALGTWQVARDTGSPATQVRLQPVGRAELRSALLELLPGAVAAR